MKVKLSVKFDHVKELRKRLDRHEINQAMADVLEEVAGMWYEDAHEITGFMKSQIEAQPSAGGISGQGGGLSGKVVCHADYAIYEINRAPLHDFTRRGFTVGQRLLKERMQALVSG